ncbi:hypothetical protein C8R45DRAFT_1103488 [Mycena sanguinolenta]|nr:hypothetical protein C8R45DRAFT_1103488 [Mycena sanguinolenta]
MGISRGGAGGVAHRGGAILAASSAVAGVGAGVSRSLRASLSSPRDGGGHGRDMGLEMEVVGMMEGYPQAHPANMDAYHAYHHIEARADSQELGFNFDGSVPHARGASRRGGFPGLALFAWVPAYAQLAYRYVAETMPGFGMLAPRKYEYEPLSLDADPGSWICIWIQHGPEPGHGHRVGGGWSGGTRV